MANHVFLAPEKYVLSNGLTVLVRETHTIPVIEAHILYHVGAADEPCHQKGIAHVIEHMLFKGTAHLSESDINTIAHKLAGSANAFTTQDYTGYTFRLPSAHWEVALKVFAECMQTARFDEHMLLSEMNAIIEELRMYKDDYASYVIDAMLAMMWPEHPYGKPVIGYHHHLSMLTRDDLISFYQQYYHPKNATLVVVGDVSAREVFAVAQALFGGIVSPEHVVRPSRYLFDDMVSKEITIARPVSVPWVCYMYTIPGAQEGSHALYDVTALMLGNGKSSRLYKRLVEQEKIAIDVECSLMSFFQVGVLCISVYPKNIDVLERIGQFIVQEIGRMAQGDIEEWELRGAWKKAMFDYSTLLESLEKQATIIGTTYLATGNTQFLKKYFKQVSQITARDIRLFCSKYLMRPYACKGTLMPLQKAVDKKRLAAMQAQQIASENSWMHAAGRETEIEAPSYAHMLQYQGVGSFTYPQPTTFFLDNGLEVVHYHNVTAPNVAMVLKFKAHALYDEKGKEGTFLWLLRLLCERSTRYSPAELNLLLESNGIFLGNSGEYLSGLCLADDVSTMFEIVAHVLIHPSFDHDSIQKIRQHICHEITDFWDTPIAYIDQIVKELLYAHHPYHRPLEGSLKSVSTITAGDLRECYQAYITPRGATMVVVGDIDKDRLKTILDESFAVWQGGVVGDIVFPEMPVLIPQHKHVQAARDQVVLALAAPSVARLDADFNKLALLDIIFTGGAQGSSNSRLFALREQSGLFYSIGGSFVYGAQEAPGLMFIKTLVSSGKDDLAIQLILAELEKIGRDGISKEEFSMAKDIAIASSVELFENNMNMAQTFLFLKRFNLNFNLFDKQPTMLSIIKLEDMNEQAKRWCNRDRFWTVTVGRTKR